jgi:PAS domain S-box-containing protein
MRRTGIAPTGVERYFGDDELIVSKTDPKGIITYANDVFVRMSGYRESELVGQPHNIVRHPAMPRSIFKLVWDTLGSGQEIFAYINNLAANGDNYWVLAHMTPSYDGAGWLVGYHSNRRSPARAAVRAAEALYAGLRLVEARQARTPDAIRAGTEELARRLADQGQTYDEFVWDLTNRSLTA